VDRRQLLKRVDKAWEAFNESYASLSDAQLMEAGVTGAWSVRDILAHVTTWEEEALKHLPLILKGSTPPRYSVLYGGIDAFNARTTEEKRSLSLSEVREQLAATHGCLIELIRSVPEHHGQLAPFRDLRRPDPQGEEAGGATGGAADSLRAHREQEDGVETAWYAAPSTCSLTPTVPLTIACPATSGGGSHAPSGTHGASRWSSKRSPSSHVTRQLPSLSVAPGLPVGMDDDSEPVGPSESRGASASVEAAGSAFSAVDGPAPAISGVDVSARRHGPTIHPVDKGLRRLALRGAGCLGSPPFRRR